MAVVFDPPWDPTTQPPKEVQKLIAPSHIHVALTKARLRFLLMDSEMMKL